jgi:hypothetical protein
MKRSRAQRVKGGHLKFKRMSGEQTEMLQKEKRKSTGALAGMLNPY